MPAETGIYLGIRVHMPNTSSARKRLRQNVKRNQRNRHRKRAVRESRRTFEACIDKGDRQGAAEALSTAFAALDKAAKVGTIAQNKANRTKSRMEKMFRKAFDAETAAG